MTATVEYFVRGMLTIARQPASPDDDAKWCAEMHKVIDQAWEQGFNAADNAAPELLAACKAMLDAHPTAIAMWVGPYRPEAEAQQAKQKARELARTAIDKAEGGAK
jgi:hypothetical protein